MHAGPNWLSSLEARQPQPVMFPQRASLGFRSPLERGSHSTTNIVACASKDYIPFTPMTHPQHRDIMSIVVSSRVNLFWGASREHFHRAPEERGFGVSRHEVEQTGWRSRR